jgi:hypothetical protein
MKIKNNKNWAWEGIKGSGLMCPDWNAPLLLSAPYFNAILKGRSLQKTDPLGKTI